MRDGKDGRDAGEKLPQLKPGKYGGVFQTVPDIIKNCPCKQNVFGFFFCRRDSECWRDTQNVPLPPLPLVVTHDFVGTGTVLL